MTQAVIDDNRLKEVFKKALIEVFEERKSMLYDLIAEVLEDLALVNAIKEGEATESMSRAEVFKILEVER